MELLRQALGVDLQLRAEVRARDPCLEVMGLLMHLKPRDWKTPPSEQQQIESSIIQKTHHWDPWDLSLCQTLGQKANTAKLLSKGVFCLFHLCCYANTL